MKRSYNSGPGMPQAAQMQQYASYGYPQQYGMYPPMGYPGMMGGMAGGMRPRGRPDQGPQNKICSFFNTDKGCAKGHTCNFLHEPVKKKPRQCSFWISGGECKKGKSCDFLHGEGDQPSIFPDVPSTQSETGDSKETSESGSQQEGETKPNIGPSSGPPRDAQAPVCAYFNSKFGCKKGENCDFRHEKTGELMRPPPQSPVDKVCDFWTTPAGCRKGALCNFKHPGFVGTQNSKESRDAKVCAYYTSPRGCIKGAVCDFLHVNPTSAYNATEGAAQQQVAMMPMDPSMGYMMGQGMQGWAMPDASQQEAYYAQYQQQAQAMQAAQGQPAQASDKNAVANPAAYPAYAMNPGAGAAMAGGQYPAQYYQDPAQMYYAGGQQQQQQQ